MDTLIIYLLISLGINIILFIPAFLLKTDKLTDFSYSLTFIVLSLMAFLNTPFSPDSLILVLMVSIWALRLGIFLVARIWTVKKDRRFDAFRDSFTGFLKFWLLQGFAVWVILIPTILFLYNDHPVICGIGFLIWFAGLFIETMADFQKFRFKLDPKNKNEFIKNGLWKYSRHPNYFGEMLCWIGIYIFVFRSFSSLNMLIALASPLFIILLLLFVSGLPQLENYADKKWGNLESYLEYKRKTSILIPWIKKHKIN